jgi:hypothetical protein
MADDGGTFFDDPVPSPLAIDRLPERQKQLFDGKEANDDR